MLNQGRNFSLSSSESESESFFFFSAIIQLINKLAFIKTRVGHLQRVPLQRLAERVAWALIQPVTDWAYLREWQARGS
jgi:hypothetical protein